MEIEKGISKKRKANKSPREANEQVEVANRRKKYRSKKVNYEELTESSEEDIFDKSRTPSGNIITQKASDIRNYFSPGKNLCKVVKTNSLSVNESVKGQPNRDGLGQEQPSVKMSTSVSDAKQHDPTQHDQSSVNNEMSNNSKITDETSNEVRMKTQQRMRRKKPKEVRMPKLLQQRNFHLLNQGY